MKLPWKHSGRIGQIALDLILIHLATLMALVLGFAPDPIPHSCWRVYVAGVGPLMLLRLGFLWRLRVYQVVWRYAGVSDLALVIKAVAASSALFGLGLWILGERHYPPAVAVLDGLLACISLGALRLYLRSLDVRPGRLEPRRRLLIVGAGNYGEALARELERRPDLPYHLVGFLDEDPTKEGLLIRSAPVLGPVDAIEAVVRAHAVQEVIIAIPSASGEKIRTLFSRCEGLAVPLRITPGFSALQPMGSTGDIPVRDVTPADLLRRPPVRVDLAAVASYLVGECVLITGAGGSIGAELVRQVLGFAPRQVLLLGRGENSLFELEQELAPAQRRDVMLLVADVRDRERLEQIFRRHQPTVVFHAAAHKHVPLMEANPEEAVKNNILGTRNLLQLAGAAKVKRFVLISSDKAVNPTSVMGTTKRIAEMLLQAQAKASPGTRFMTVRFGNVLGSRGSVVQSMRRQIQNRQPVTVTHPDMIRYFMTIPEAVQLVIQAGALGAAEGATGRGEVFVLDMGAPVRILDLAHDLIRLSGLVPGEDVPIQFIGLRPGEKLHEELLTAQEGTSMTRFERILTARLEAPDPAWLEPHVEELIRLAAEGRTEELLLKLSDIVPEYRRSAPEGEVRSSKCEMEAGPSSLRTSHFEVRTLPKPAFPQ